MPTRGQVRRAIEWEKFLKKPRLKRGKTAPGCVTCGREPDGEFVKGQPSYRCQHEPLRLDAETLARGRREFGAERDPV